MRATTSDPEDGILLREIEFCGSYIWQWEHLDYTPNFRMYYTKTDIGFGAIAVEFIQAPGNAPDVWQEPEIRVGIVFYGEATFDGMRHFNVGDDGYLHYPDFTSLARAFEAINGLIKMHCPQGIYNQG
jgi:hypothetical protein